MNKRSLSTMLASALIVVALGATAHAQAQGGRLEPMPGIPGFSVEPEKIPELIKGLQKDGLPFEIDIGMRFRCLGSLCTGIVRPNSIPAQPTQTLPCQDLSGDARIKCLEAFIRANPMLR